MKKHMLLVAVVMMFAVVPSFAQSGGSPTGPCPDDGVDVKVTKQTLKTVGTAMAVAACPTTFIIAGVVAKLAQGISQGNIQPNQNKSTSTGNKSQPKVQPKTTGGAGYIPPAPNPQNGNKSKKK